MDGHGRSALQAIGIRRAFGSAVALAGVDLEVDRGTVHALLGPNGAGKSTLVRVLGGLLRPDAGTATVAGFDVRNQRRAVRSVIGVVGQFPTVDERLSARENLVLVGRLCRMSRTQAKQRAAELVAAFDLGELADRRVETYSGGTRRRVDLAAGLVHRPEVLLLDEPTTGLDPRARHQVWDLLRDLVCSGTTVLLTTQHLDEAENLADAITVLHHGRVAGAGTSEDLKRQFGRTVVDLTFETDDEAHVAIDELSRLALAVTEQVDRRARVLAVDPADDLPRLIRCLDAARIRASAIDVRPPTLDDVVIGLTGDAADSDAVDGDATESDREPLVEVGATGRSG